MSAHPLVFVHTTIIRLFALCALLIAELSVAAPAVGNLNAAQRAGTKLVDIQYDIAATGFATVAVSLEISSDGGVTWTVPATSVSGAIGSSVAPGTGKIIVWDAGADWPRGYSTQMRFRVIADDGVPAILGFSYVPSGSFTMGRTSGDSDSDAPPITVTLSGFYIQQKETTKAEWDDVRTWGSTRGYSDLVTGGGKAPNHAVHSVTWSDVVKWCNARSEKEGLIPVYTVSGAVLRTGTTSPQANWSVNGYRLPTEAEWEKAARGGIEGKRFPWGTDMVSHSNANYSSWPIFYDTNGHNTPTSHPMFGVGGWPFTAPVASFEANGFGLYDMAGNVWEWCWDRYAALYYADGAINPRGPDVGNRVLRGGSWGASEGARRVRCGSRASAFTPSIVGSDSFGFRCARTTP
jgi:formylglycine-generating enzyme